MELLVILSWMLIAMCNVAAQILPTAIISPDQYGAGNTTYDIVNITWALEAEPYIPKHNYIGTIQEVVGHINDNYPNYTWPDVDLTYLSGNTMDTSVAELSEPSERGIVHCWRFNMTTTSAAWEGIAYLNSIPGKPSNGPGPGACGRVSCADDAGIWWCNDNPDTTMILGGFNWIANYTTAIMQQCQWMGGEDTVTRGQSFHPTENWNVILGGARC